MWGILYWVNPYLYMYMYIYMFLAALIDSCWYMYLLLKFEPENIDFKIEGILRTKKMEYTHTYINIFTCTYIHMYVGFKFLHSNKSRDLCMCACISVSVACNCWQLCATCNMHLAAHTTNMKYLNTYIHMDIVFTCLQRTVHLISIHTNMEL